LASARRFSKPELFIRLSERERVERATLFIRAVYIDVPELLGKLKVARKEDEILVPPALYVTLEFHNQRSSFCVSFRAKAVESDIQMKLRSGWTQ
jgi:hypothetical protein